MAEPEPEYLWITNWEKFQHYKDRTPIWIKFYVALLSDDDYLSLSEHRALLLHRLWLAFASSRCRLRLDTSSLSRHCFLRVTTADIESLKQAGFIEIIDSNVLAKRLQDASPDVEKEVEKEQPFLPSTVVEDADIDFDTPNGGGTEGDPQRTVPMPELRSIA